MKDFRLLTIADLEGALTLSSTAGWNQQLADWRMLLTLAPRGSVAVFDGERIVGTSIGIDYEGFGWIAMMLVDPAYRGRGLGRRLLESAMNAIPPDRPVRLDATPMGRPLYQSFSFEDEALLSRHVAEPSARRAATEGGSNDVHALTGADLGTISERDRQAFGGNRGVVLEWALDRAPQYARVVGGERNRRQYCFGRQGRLFDQIGPVVADDDETARQLVTAALPGAEGRAVVIDAFDSRGVFTGWLKSCGFRVERPLFRMCRPGAGRATETRNRQTSGLREFAIFGPEFG